MLKTLIVGWLALFGYTAGMTGYLIYRSVKHR